MRDLVSVIIPVYNSAAFLQKSLENLLQQTYPNLEIIVVDDESTDNSYAIAKQFEPKGLQVLQQKNAGAAVARNTGLSASTGNYIQFLDADDYLSPDKIEKQVAALDGRYDKVALCNYISFVSDDELDKEIKLEDQSLFIYSSDHPAEFLINLLGSKGESNFIQTNCWLVPRAILNKSGRWRNYRCPDDDGEFFSRVLLASEGIVYVPGVMNYYRRADTEHKLSANSNKKYLQNTLLTIDLKYRYLKEKTNDKKIQKAFARQYFEFAVYNYYNHRILSKIALKRYGQMNETVKPPLLGGKMVEIVKKIFGWKTALLIKSAFN